MDPTTTIFYQQLGQCIRHLRQQQGLSQRHLAEALGISYQQVQKYEAGTNRLSITNLLAVSELLRTSPCILITLAVEGIKIRKGTSLP